MNILKKNYYQAVSSGADDERADALDTLIDRACAIKEVDPGVEENRKQMKYQLLSRGKIDRACSLNEEIPGVEENTKEIKPQLLSRRPRLYAGLILMRATVNLDKLETNLAVVDDADIPPHKRQKRPSFPRTRGSIARTAGRKVCSSGRNNRKKSAYYPRGWRTSSYGRGGARPRRGRNALSRREQKEIRIGFAKECESFSHDLQYPGAFADHGVRWKYERLRGKNVHHRFFAIIY